MRRAVLPLALLVVWLGVLAGAASADTRPRVAVLGLEVTSTVDVRTTELAHDLTEGMRARARLGSGPYAYAPGSERELIDEKLIKQCDNEAIGCMAEIGKELDADIIVYGKLDKEGKSVRLTLQLLDVQRKTKVNRLSSTMPSDATKEAVKTFARKAYEELAGASAAGGAGTVEVEANVTDGKVYVDDASSDALVNGRATLTLPEGRYRIAVEAPGHQRKEITVTVKAEQVLTQAFELRAGSAPERKKGFDIWKPAFGVMAAGTTVFGVYSLYLLSKWKNDANAIEAEKPDPRPISSDDCDGPNIRASAMVIDKNGVLGEVCRTRNTQITMGIVAGVFAVLMIPTGYFVFIHKSPSERKRVAITPLLTPTEAGAVVNLTW